MRIVIEVNVAGKRVTLGTGKALPDSHDLRHAFLECTSRPRLRLACSDERTWKAIRPEPSEMAEDCVHEQQRGRGRENVLTLPSQRQGPILR